MPLGPTVPCGRKPGQELEQRSRRGAVYWPALRLLLSQCLTGPGLPAQWAEPTSIHSELENVPQPCPQASLMGAIPQLQFPPRKCVKLTMKTNEDTVTWVLVVRPILSHGALSTMQCLNVLCPPRSRS